MRIRSLLLALALLPTYLVSLSAQDAPKRPADVFRAARDYLQSGSLELAAGIFKDFADLKPTEQDYLDLEAKYGANIFQSLRNVPRWLPDAKKDAEFKQTVIEGIIEASMKANEKLTRDPLRLRRFALNLGESKEERDFAIAELNRAGAAAVPPIIENLRINTTPEYRAGALTAVSRLNAETIPGFLVAAENLPEELKVGILRSIAFRPDSLNLLTKADTSIVPYLWYLASSENPGELRDAANRALQVLSGDRSDRQQVDTELVKYATNMFDRKGNFAGFDSARNRVRLLVWDPAAINLKSVEMTKSQAEELYGLKYLKWAIERRPDSRAAQELFLALATERAVERAGFNDLAKAEPGISQVLASAPADMLISLLESALAENRTALAYGIAQTLGNRAEKSAGISTEKRPSVLVKALNYSDPRVQMAAATALLKMPSVEHGANARIVEVLSRSASGETATAPNVVGRALVVDPLGIRSSRVALLLRGLGYETEIFGTGRELFKRINRSSDFDAIVIDRHVVEPELKDVLTNLSANSNAGRRPILVVASSDAPAPVNVERALLRLAVLLAVTETTEILVPPPYENDKRKPKEENDDIRKSNISTRDGRLMQIFQDRLARMQRIVEAANLGQSEDLQALLKLRTRQLVMAALIAEYETTAEFAPTLYRDLKNYTELIRNRPELAKAAVNAPTDALIRMIEHLETILSPNMQEKFERITARIDSDELGVTRARAVDPIIEARLNRLARQYRNVTVIPEPYSVGSTSGPVKFGLGYEIQASIADPSQRPRDPAERKSTTKLAVEWLRKLAVGERKGYDLMPALAALRTALNSDETAPAAIEAIARIPAAEAQRDLARLAATPSRPSELRDKSVDLAIQHIQAYGKMTIPEVDQVVASLANAETNPELKSKLANLSAALTGKPGDLSNRIKTYTIPSATPATTPPAAPKTGEEKPAEEKKQ